MRTNELARGTLYLMAAQGVFLLSNYCIHFWLGRTLSPALYGVCGVIFSFLFILRIPLESGMGKAVSKYTAEGKYPVHAVRSCAIKFQFFLALAFSGVVLVIAPFIAKSLKDPGLTPYLRMAATFIPIFAASTVYMGILNGARSFGKQAIVTFIYSGARIATVFLLVSLGYGIYGVLSGYFISAVIGLVIVRSYCADDGRREDISFNLKPLISFAAPIIFFSTALTVMMSLDIFFVKALLLDAAKTGFYTSASVLAKVPYFIFAAFSMTLFPSIARSASDDKNIELTKKYIDQALRYSLLLLIPLACIVSATSRNLVTFVYSTQYAEAAMPLSILIFGMSLLSVFIIFTTIINASGKPVISFITILAMLLAACALNLLLIPRYGITGAALATSLSSLLGLFIVAFYVFHRFHTLIRALSVFKILLASFAAYFIALHIPAGGILLLALYLFLACIYIALLALLGEIKKEDLQIIRGIING
ncbi:MAG: flippase [Candidatus Omnitrophota bacterium]